MRAQTIKALRLGLKLTQEEFAQKLGVTRWTIMRWESGTSDPHQVFIRAIERLKVEVGGQSGG